VWRDLTQGLDTARATNSSLDDLWPLTRKGVPGTMAILDPLGRAASMSVGFQNGGQALGPALASIILGESGYAGVGFIGLTGLSASLVLCSLVLRRDAAATIG
jgi:hypothetical protein